MNLTDFKVTFFILYRMVNVNDRVFKNVETRGKRSNRGVVIAIKFCSTRLAFDTLNVEFLSLNGVFK